MKLVTATRCVKCGSTDIRVSWHKQGCPDKNCSCASCTYGSHAKEHTEHLHYTCRETLHERARQAHRQSVQETV